VGSKSISPAFGSSRFKTRSGSVAFYGQRRSARRTEGRSSVENRSSPERLAPRPIFPRDVRGRRPCARNSSRMSRNGQIPHTVGSDHRVPRNNHVGQHTKSSTSSCVLFRKSSAISLTPRSKVAHAVGWRPVLGTIRGTRVSSTPGRALDCQSCDLEFAPPRAPNRP